MLASPAMDPTADSCSVDARLLPEGRSAALAPRRGMQPPMERRPVLATGDESGVGDGPGRMQTVITSKGVWRQVTAGVSVGLSVMMVGSIIGWAAPVELRLRGDDSPVPMSGATISWVVAGIEVGAFLSAIPSGLLVDRCGRKAVLLASAPPVLLGWLLIILILSPAALIAARILHGTSVGLVFAIAPMYLAEIAEPRHRGALTTLFPFMCNLGLLVAYVLGAYLSYHAFAWSLALLPIAFVATFALVPDTPYYFLVRGQETRAASSLAWFRGENSIVMVEEELARMKASVDDDMKDKASWRDIVATPNNKRALACVQVVAVTLVMSGAWTIQSYASSTFDAASASFLAPDQFTILLGVLVLAVTLLEGAAVDSMGRRPLLLVSAFFGGVSQTVAAVYFYLDAKTDVDVSGVSWVAFASIASYLLLISIGILPLVTTLQAELFPSSTRGIASGITGTTMTITSFLCLIMYRFIADSAGMYLNYAIFAAFAFAGSVIIYFLVPETKGKTFAEIQMALTAGKANLTIK